MSKKLWILAILIASVSIWGVMKEPIPKKSFGSCLEERNLTIYYLPQCHHSQKALEVVKSYNSSIEFINCEKEENIERCKKIIGVPAYGWGTKTRFEYGEKNITEIKEMLKCEE